ncbi:MAG: sporulation integral membrane protein YtvI [Clostridia bacterium]|nr:sporulation integral membrane protein YtvI [Clostridia bacterium]
MNILPQKLWSKILVSACYIIIGILSIYFLFSKIFSVIAPFIFALLLGRILQSPIDSLEKRLHLPRRLIGFTLTLILILFLGFVAVLVGNQLISEGNHIFEILSKNSEKIINTFSSFLEDLGKKFPFIYERLDREVVLGTASEAINNVISTLTAELARFLTATVKAVPGILLFFAVFVIASFYFSMDYCSIKEKIKGYLPKILHKVALDIKDTMRSAGIQYLKAYSIILLITFAQLFIGFIILKTDYALILALVIALLDMLPVLGTGSVLIPWAITEFFMGETRMGIGLLILFAVIAVVREFIEPKIVGNCIGMHPLLTLVSMYAGYRFFGLWGVIFLVPTVMIIKNCLDKYLTKP